jgi:hypothetical protein
MKRTEKKLSSLSLFPPENITPGGWVKRHIAEDATNGWVPKCDRMSRQGVMAWDPNSRIEVPYFPPPSKWMHSGREAWDRAVPYYQPLIDKLGSYGEGEFQAHWMDMLFRQTFIGKFTANRKLADQCINDILESTDESGYIGVDLPQVRFTGKYITPFGLQNGDFEMSGMGSIFDALLLYHEYTGEKKIVKAVIAAVDLMLARTKGKETMGHCGGPLMVNPLAKLFLITGKKEYLKRARIILDYCLREQVANIKQSHSAAVGITVLAILDLYLATGEKKLLDRAVAISDEVGHYALQSHGAPTGHGENLALSGPAVNTEGCDIAWWTWVWLRLAVITGQTRFADLAEKCVLNALPAARSEDGSAGPYFLRPNQLFATRGSGQGTVFGARLLIECCLGNLGRIMPIFAEHMITQTAEGGLAALFYGPCRFETSKIKIIQKTDYPFSDKIKILVNPKKQSSKLSIRLRIPAWCKSPSIKVNGQTVQAAGPWVELNRTWKRGDSIELTLPMDIQVQTDPQGLITVQRGPLLYALPIRGRRIPVDPWGSFEEIVTDKNKWNYALVLNQADPAASFRVKNLSSQTTPHVWAYPPSGLEVSAIRLKDWKFKKTIPALIPSRSTDIPEPAAPKPPFKKIGKKEKILLIPFAFTHLRMTHLPMMLEK